MEACLVYKLLVRCASATENVDARHNARHADQTVHTTEAYADAPKSSPADHPLTQSLISGLETEDRSVAIGNSLVDFSSRMISKSWVVHMESQGVKVFGNDVRRGLLPVHAESECFNSAEQKKRVDGCESVSNRVYCKCYLLFQGKRLRSAYNTATGYVPWLDRPGYKLQRLP